MLEADIFEAGGGRGAIAAGFEYILLVLGGAGMDGTAGPVVAAVRAAGRLRVVTTSSGRS